MLLALLMISTTVWAGGAQEEVSEDGSVTLTLFHHMSEEAKRLGIEALVAGYIAKNPNVTFDIQAMDFGQYASTLKTKIAADDAPDIMFGRPKSYIDLVRAGHLMELSGESYLNGMQDSALPALTIDGKVYGILLDVSALGTYYNKDIFAANGIEKPETYDELMAALKKLDAAGIPAFSRGYKDGWTAQVDFGAFCFGGMLRAHPEYMGEVTEGTKKWADYPELKQALKSWSDTLGYNNDDIFGTDYSKSIELFATGQTAMFTQGLWALGEIRKISPDVNIGFMTPPAFNDMKLNNLTIFGDDAFMMSATTKHADVANDFFAFCMSPEGGKIWSEIAGQVSFLKNAGTDYSDPVHKDFLEYINSGQTVGQEDGSFFAGQMDATYREYQELFPARKDHADIDKFIADMDKEFDAIR